MSILVVEHSFGQAADAEALQASLRAAETPFGRVWVA
jgi:hypothetical protein